MIEHPVVVMGVAGCGKSSLGAALAQAEGALLIEGDEHHSDANRDKMRRGIPLTDADRAGWLQVLGDQLRARPAGAVLTCSALKRAYRDRLRAAIPGLRFAWLDLSAAAAQERVAQRAEHFFPAGLVATQFDTLEPPHGEAGVLHLDALQAPPALAQRVADWLACTATQGPR